MKDLNRKKEKEKERKRERQIDNQTDASVNRIMKLIEQCCDSRQ